MNCRFTYDINGLLEVDVHVPLTGERKQLLIVDEGGPSGAELEQQRKALEALKIHPRETDANRAAMARAKRCYENLLGNERDYVGHLIGNFETLLDRQDPHEIDKARQVFLAALDRIEGETFL